MFDDLIARASAAYRIPQAWIRGVIEIESSWNPDAESWAGARGLMQIMPATGRGYGVADSDLLFVPAVNIDVGTHLLADLRRQFGDDLNKILSAYNAGPRNAGAWATNPEIAEYVRKVSVAIEEFFRLQPLAVGAAAGGGAFLLFLGVFVFLSRKKRK